MNEAAIQARLIRHVLVRKHHVLAVPNSTMLLTAEADLLSVTRAGYVHEYEIKCSLSDYNREIKAINGQYSRHNHNKVGKHVLLKQAYKRTANYFWFVTYEFDIEPPEHCGWIKIVRGLDNNIHPQYKKNAPRLHTNKWGDKELAKTARILSFRLMDTLL